MKIRKMIQTAFHHPFSFWSRNRSPMIAKSANRYAMNAKLQKKIQTMFQKLLHVIVLSTVGAPPWPRSYAQASAERPAADRASCVEFAGVG